MSDANDAEISAFWADARVRGGLNPAESYLGATPSDMLPPPAWSFGATPQESDRLLELVLTGRKTATSTALRAYEDEARRRAEAEDEDVDGPDVDGPGADGHDAGGHDAGAREGDTLVRTAVDVALPEPGLLSIVLDGADTPRALIRTTHVDVVRYADVDADHARREGEWSLEEWRRVNRRILAEQLPPDEEVTDDTEVVLERFVVVVPAGARRAAKRAGLL